MNRQKSRQLGFECLEMSSVKHFGGSLLKNSHAKTKRPITTKRSMHLVMRSVIAKGHRSLLRNAKRIEKIIFRQGQIHGVKVYRLANAGNHLHLIILPRSRAAFHAFVRSVSGLIAREVLETERGAALTSNHDQQAEVDRQQFWEQRPFTRIVEWGRDYRKVCSYLNQNTLEALGFILYQPRKHQGLAAG